MRFDGLDAEDARAFAERWLPAWTGGEPDRLLAFYTDDAFYCDPAIPDGVSGQEALRDYFGRLLGRFPNWVWTHEGSAPLPGGFINHWRAVIPVGDQGVVCTGVCTVRLRDGLIEDNRVYFDRTPLLEAMAQGGGGSAVAGLRR